MKQVKVSDGGLGAARALLLILLVMIALASLLALTLFGGSWEAF